MGWLGWLMLAAIVTGLAAVTGIKVKGTRHVAHTSMMGIARIALGVIVLIFALLAYRMYAGG